MQTKAPRSKSPDPRAPAPSAPAPGAAPAASPTSAALLQLAAGTAAGDVGPQGAPGIAGRAGAPLDAPTRAYMEWRFGQSFGGVRVHTDGAAASAAESLGAAAFTAGHHIAFRAGSYVPGTPAGRQLLAHELAHVARHGHATAGTWPVAAADTADEREADAAARVVGRGHRASLGVSPATRPALRLFRYRPGTPAERYRIASSVGTVAQQGQFSSYRLETNAAGAFPPGGSGRLEILWTVEVGGTEQARYLQAVSAWRDVIAGPRVPLVREGANRITAHLTEDGATVETVVFEQQVSQSGTSQAQADLSAAAGATTVDAGTREWTTTEFLSWQAGTPTIRNFTIHQFKRQWVHGYRRVIRAAAQRFALPEVLLAGVCYNEVGGDPQWVDSVARAVRGTAPGTRSPQLTSFGNVSTQIRRAAETLGYDPVRMSQTQEDAIVASLEDPRQNIFIAASHLADLRDIDFPAARGGAMTLEQMRVVATRFNRGPDLTLAQIQADMSYGQRVLDRFVLLFDALRD